jgi:hypothetical protein
MQPTDLIKYLDEIPEDYDDFFNEIPYAKQAISAYNWYRKWRISLFLKSIEFSAKPLSQKEKDKFEKYLNSKIGRELLAEYSDTVLRTSSKVAIAALGVLYADTDNEFYNIDFKRIACRALEGATDTLLNGFIFLCELDPKPETGPYPLRLLTQGFIESNSQAKEIIGSAEDAFAIVNHLIRKSMLLPDHVPSRIGGGKWFINYGVTDISIKIKDLILKAKQIVET